MNRPSATGSFADVRNLSTAAARRSAHSGGTQTIAPCFDDKRNVLASNRASQYRPVRNVACVARAYGDSMSDGKGKTQGKYEPGGYDLRVKRSSAGLGLFAGEDIPAGRCVIEYVGRILSEKEVYATRSKYLFEVSRHRTIDGKPKWGNPAGYINHSCAPNCEATVYRGRAFIFSLRAIAKGEELSYDYGEDYCLDHCTPCRCPAESHLYKKAVKD